MEEGFSRRLIQLLPFAFLLLPLEKVAYQRLLFEELCDGGVDLFLAEAVQRHALDDFAPSACGADRERTDEAWLDAIAAVRTDSNAVPIALRGRSHKGVHRVDNGVCGRGSRRGSPRLDDRRPALLDGGNEDIL